ncbi:MAG: hypothetical protein ACOH2R_19935 [Pseudomonas sp.]
MSELIPFCLAMTAACFLIYGLKNRTYRKWLGIVFSIAGIALMFGVASKVDEFDPGLLFLAMWCTGLTLFFERDRYEEDE